VLERAPFAGASCSTPSCSADAMAAILTHSPQAKL
jgi:hypothetical protein